MAIQMKAVEQYFHVVLFIFLYKVVRTVKSADGILLSDHSIESYYFLVLPFDILNSQKQF